MTQESNIHQIGCELLILLGDAKRHSAKISDCKDGSQQEALEVARACYERAAKLYPFDGRPHNQLAIVKGLSNPEDLLDRLVSLSRALSAEIPFPQAKAARDSVLAAAEGQLR